MKDQGYSHIISILMLSFILGCSTTPEEKSSSVLPQKNKTIQKKYSKELLKELSLTAKQLFPNDSLLIDFYTNRKQLIWFTPDSFPIPEVTDFKQKIAQSLSYGISPDDFLSVDTNENIITQELYLTKNYNTFGRSISLNDSITKDINWLAILEYGKHNQTIIKELLSLQPNNPEYKRLQKGLEQYLSKVQLSDSVVQVPNFKKDSLKSYTLAQKALFLHGLLPTPTDNDSLEVITALQSFQYQHGLETDGIIGKATAKELSKSTNFF